MKLQMFARSTEKKKDVLRERRAGRIPAVIYVEGKAAEPIAIPSNEFSSLLRQVQPGRLSTTVFSLKAEKGKERPVLIKEIQYHPTTYDVIHLDFEELHDNVPVKAKVPVELTGVVECVGVKLGGFLRQVIRTLKVRCLPKDLPQVFTIDIRDMNVGQAKRLSELAIPESVRPLADLHEVAVVVSKR